MCGIFGYVNGSVEKPADPRLTETLIQKMRHRGPDDSGSYADGNYAVSHLRLSIIDLSRNGHQPMLNAARTACIAFNGEIYNFRELKAKYGLGDKFPFVSKTDSEVVLYLYERLGPDFVRELNGMFALAIWDGRRKQLLLARDRFGIKPLFYTIHDGALWFSSEIKSLLGIPGFRKEVCFKAVHNYFSFDYIPGEETAFENIKEVRPGFMLRVGTGESLSVKPERYWTPRYGQEKPRSVPETVAEVQELLVGAVKSQLISDVPVGVMLSGGMDSSTLTALMAHVRGDADFHTFSIGFDEPSFDESPYAEIVAKEIGTTHHAVKITAQTVRDNLERYLSFIDEPYADGSAIPTFMLAQEARKFVTVLLSGEGGDEVFAGYDTHKAYLVNRLYKKIPKPARWLVAQAVARLPVSHRKLSFDFKAKKFIRGTNFSVPHSHYLWREVFTEEEKKELLRVPLDLERAYGPSFGLFVDLYAAAEGGDELNKLLQIDCSFHLPDDLMIKNDRMTMAHSLEARVPFTDYPLFDYMANIAGTSKIKLNMSKLFMKKAMAPFLPERILKKKKVGLEMPYSKWFLAELKDILCDHLSPESLARIPFLDAACVQRIIRDHMEGRRDYGRELWGLLNFAVWHRLYFSS